MTASPRAALVVLLTLTLLPSARAQSDPPLDQIVRTNGTRLKGLILSEDSAGVRFMVVMRRPNKKTLTMTSVVARGDIARIERISPAQREAWRQRLAGNKAADKRAAKTESDLELERAASRLDPRRQVLRFEGSFTLESTAPEELTRAAVVQLQRVNAAFRATFPPGEGAAPARRLHVYLFGTVRDYRKAVGLPIANGAVYIPARHAIFMGTEAAQAEAQTRQVREEAAALQAKVDAGRKQASAYAKSIREGKRKQVEQLNALLRAKQISAADAQTHRKKISAWEKAENKKLSRFKDRLAMAEGLARKARVRQTNALLEHHDALLRTLNHEAFHAYVRSGMLPPEQVKRFPRWAEEGCAQLFEHAVLEGQTLRPGDLPIDSLRWLKAQLSSGQALPLKRLLATGQADFVIKGERVSDHARRCYLQSWALCRYLTTHPRMAGKDPLRLLARVAGDPAGSAAGLIRQLDEDLPTIERKLRAKIESMRGR